MVKVLGHRGCAGIEPENTIRAFKRAIDLGVDFIELDVRKSRDKKLIVVHEDKVDRTTNKNGSYICWQISGYRIDSKSSSIGITMLETQIRR